MKKQFYIIIIGLFFLSGMAALIYQVAWASKLGLVFGNTAYAIGAILTIFMIGLAIGSIIFGKIVDKIGGGRKSFLLFGFLEVGVGLYAFLTPLFFLWIERLQIRLVQLLELNIPSTELNLLRIILSFSFLIVPTILMGGTLPVIAKIFITLKQEIGEKFALLYSVNTFGGVVGVILAGFFLIIPFNLGVNGTIYTAAIIDTLVGLSFLIFSWQGVKILKKPEIKIKEEKPLAVPFSFHFLIFSAFFITGFLALGLEVLWTRALILVVGNSTYAFSLILIGFLTGIALGAALVRRFIDKVFHLGAFFAAAIAGTGIFIIIITPFIDRLPVFFLRIFSVFQNSPFWQFELGIFIFIFFVLLFPTILMGISFPLGIKLYTKNFFQLGQSIGGLYAIDAMGGALGSFVAAFFLLPLLGLQYSIIVLALGYLILAIVLSFFLSRSFFRLATIGICLIAIFFSFSLPEWNKYAMTSGSAVYAFRYLFEPKAIYGEPWYENILFYQDGLLANVAVTESPKGFLAMRVNGKVDASAGHIAYKEIGDMDTMMMLGYLPIFLHPKEPENALIVGLGSGVTLGAMTQYDFKEIDLVEIEPTIIKGAEYFKEFNNNALNDSKVRIIIEDGRNLLLVSPKKYDIISSQPSNPWVKGNANLFTREYYSLAKNRLKQDGIMVQWVQLYNLEQEDLASVLLTFNDVFPYVQVWFSPSFRDVFLIGSVSPLTINEEMFRERFSFSVLSDLERAGLANPDLILSHFLFTQEKIKNLNLGKIHSDNFPFLEFNAPKSLYKETVSLNLEMLLAMKEEVEDVFNLSIAENEKNFIEYFSLAVFFRQQAEIDKAVQYYEKALTYLAHPIVEGQLAQDYFIQAKIAQDQGNKEEAIIFYKKAVEMNPLEPDFLINLAINFQVQGKTEKAEYWFRKAIETSPWYIDGFYGLGLLLIEQKKIEEAEYYLHQGLEINSKNIEILNLLAIAAYSRGDFEAVRNFSENSLRINPNQPIVKERLKELK